MTEKNIQNPHKIIRPAIWILVLMVSVGPFGDTEYTPGLTSIAKDFGVEYSTTILTMTSYLIAYAISQIFYGPISDRYGRRPVMLFGACVFIIGSIICLVSTDIYILIAGRFVQAIGACAGAVISNSAVRDAYPEGMRSRVYAKINAAFAIAPGLGPMVGAYIDALYHWRFNFLVLLVLSGILLACVYFFFPETNLNKNPRATEVKHALHNYKKLFRDPYYAAYVTVLGLCVGVVYNCLTEAPMLVSLMNLNTISIVIIAACVMSGFIIGSLTCNYIYAYMRENTIILTGLIVMMLASTLLYFTLSMKDATLFYALGPIIIIFAGIAMVLPMSTARAMLPFSSITGSAAALLGLVQMGIAGLCTAALSIMHKNTPLMMPVSFLILGSIAILVFIFFVLLRPHKKRVGV